MPILLDPISIGEQQLSNRIFMAPMTRMRAGTGDCPTALTSRYYGQRAQAGLIITEATQISPEGKGYFGTPGIHTDPQEAAWASVVQAVHQLEGHISLQLWHVGRISHSLNQLRGLPPVAPSVVPVKRAKVGVFKDGRLQEVLCEPPRALETEEIGRVVREFVEAGKRARRAGFDFVEVHAANGYLINQFLATNTNLRTDQYGGTVSNRARFLLEIIDALGAEIGQLRVGVRLSPFGVFNDIEDTEALPMALLLASELSRRRIAYLHIAEPDWAGGIPLTSDFRKALRARYEGPLIYCGNHTAQTAEGLMQEQLCDAIAFGRSFLANPDLVSRISSGFPLAKADPTTFYFGGVRGYTDYPAFVSVQP